MSAPVALSFLVYPAILAGVLAVGIRARSRVLRYVAPTLEARRWRWDGWHSAVLLEGALNGVSVCIRSTYAAPLELSVTLRVATHPPDLEASLHPSGQVEYRSIRSDDRVRVLAHVLEDEPPRPGPPHRAAIHAYFTPARVQHLQALLRGLGWDRFLLDREGITVSRFGKGHGRWKPDQARYELQRALTELQGMVPDAAAGIEPGPTAPPSASGTRAQT